MKDDESAFPCVSGDLGMSLRDYFAGQALVGAISSSRVFKIGEHSFTTIGEYAEISYMIADAMLKEREK